MVAASEVDAMETDRARLTKSLQDNMTLFVQLLALGVALWGPLIVIMIWMSGNFIDIRQDIAELDKRLTAQINELDARLTAQINELDVRLTAQINELDVRLTAQINELDARLTAQINELDARLTAQINELDTRLTAQIQAMDSKLSAIGDMTVVAFTDGEITSGELVTIWQRANMPAEQAE